MHARNAAAQIRDRVEGIAGADDSFETADIDAQVIGDLLAACALGQRMQGLWSFSGLPGLSSHQTRSSGALDREQADGAMRRMGRIEGAAEQPDAHAICVERDGGAG